MTRRLAPRWILRLRRAEPEPSPDRLYAYLDALWRCREDAGACWRSAASAVGRRGSRTASPGGAALEALAVDTFNGVRRAAVRGGSQARHRRAVRGCPQRPDAVRRSLDADGCEAMRLVEGDIETLPDSALPAAVAVCLLDMNREVPTYAGLCRVFDRLARAGSRSSTTASRAVTTSARWRFTRRFVGERGLPEEYFMTMGIVRALTPRE